MRKLLLPIFFLLLVSNSLFAATWYVRSGGSGNGSSAAAAFGTISAAIAAAQAGDIIDIGPGTFVERLKIDKSLELRGHNAGKTHGNWVTEVTRILPPTTNFATAAEGALAYIEASGVTLDGIEFNGANDNLSDAPARVINGVNARSGWGIAVVTGTLSNLRFLNNHFRNFTSRGVFAASSTIQNNLVEVKGNLFHNITGVNNQLAIAILTTNHVPVVTGNKVTDSNFGVLLQFSASPDISGTATVSSNSIDAHVVGVAVRGFSSAIAPALLVKDNTVSRIDYAQWTADGLTKPTEVEFTGLDFENLLGNNLLTIENNTVTGARSATYFLNIEKSATAPDRVLLKDNLLQNSRFGVYVDNASTVNSRVAVSGTTIRNGVIVGVQIMGNGNFENEVALRNGTVIEHPSTAIDEYSNAIFLTGAKATLTELGDTKISSAKWNFIVFDNNAMAGKEVDGNNVTYDGTVNGFTFNNYKPSANPNNALRAAVKDRIGDGEDANNTGSGIVRIAAVPNSTWYVRVGANGNGATAENALGTINAALAAANNGDIIDIGSGSFQERLSITKSVDIRGANAGKAPWNWTNAATKIMPPTTNFESAAAGALGIIEANGVKIDGIDFDGANNSLNDAAPRTINGVASRSGWGLIVSTGAYNNLQFLNNRIRNFTVRGLAAASTAIQNTTFLVKDNTFENITGTNNTLAISVLTTNYLPQVSGNRVTNSNFGVLLQYSGSPNISGLAQVSNNQINAHVVGIAVRGFSNAIAPPISVQLNTIAGIDYVNWEADGLTKPASLEFTGLDFENLLGDNTINIIGNDVTGARSAIYFLNIIKSATAPDRVTVTGNLLKDSQGGIYIDNATTGDTRVIVSNTTVRNATRVGMQVMGEGNFTNDLVLRNGVLIEHPAAISTEYNDAIYLQGEKALLTELNDTKISNVKFNFITFANNAMAGREVDANNVTFDGTVNGFTFNNYKPSTTSVNALRAAAKDRINDGEDANFTGSGIVRIAAVTGLQELAQYTNIQVYPNPTATGSINIHLKGIATKSLEVVLYSQAGQVVTSQEVTVNPSGTQVQLSTQGLAKGIYLLKLSDGNATSTRKVIVQ
ncbi:MAG: T9SS type A sorting domain-containing protein [Rufibacter sp.]